MGQRPAAPGVGQTRPARLLREIARDAAALAGAPLAELLLPGGPPAPVFDGPGLAAARRPALARALRRPTAARPPRPGGRAALSALDPGLARLLGLPARPAPCAVLVPLGGAGRGGGWIRFFRAGRPDRAARGMLRAVARQAAARLEVEGLRRQLAERASASRRLQLGAGEAILLVDAATGQVLDANARASALTGLGLSGLRRTTAGRLVEHPQLDEEGVLAWLGGTTPARDDEAFLRRPHGELVPVALTTARLQLGDRAAIHIIARDVTGERRTLSDLRQAKETLAALGLAGAHLMVETDQRAVYGVICRELLRLGFHSAVLEAEHGAAGPRPPFRYAFTSFGPQLQRATERLLGRPLSTIHLDPEASPLLRQLLGGGRLVHTDRARGAARELFGGATDAQVKPLFRLLGLRHVLLAPLRYDQGISGILVVATARLRRSDPEAIDAFALQASIALEKARLFAELRQQHAVLESEVDRRTRELTLAVRALQELDRRKDNFLANVSHELRTPLVTVLGYADLLLAEKVGEVSERQRECLRTVVSSARRLRSFIDELLEFSRHELTKEGLSFQAFDLGDLLQLAQRTVAPRFHERGISLRRRVARGTPLAWGDRDRMLQVLSNLLGNAARYASAGGRVRLAASRVRAGRLGVSVTDDGPGIAEEHLQRIFDRLYQVGDVSQPRQDGAGLGLGLAIARNIVEAHGGTIAARSTVGRGTTFRFTLPSVESAGEALAAPRPPPAPPAPPP